MPSRDIIVVGASAGGVEALQTLVSSLPASLPATILVVLHIPAHSPSHLHLILDRAGELPAMPASDGAPIAPGRVYVAVPDQHLLIEEDRIRVTRGPKENRARPAIDALFRSAAYAFGPRVIGVVLSGNLDDGTAGLWAIKDRGGIALVQSPQEAQFSSMPESALQHVAVDHVLPIADMPSVISNLTRDNVMAGSYAPVPELMAVETHIALQTNGPQGSRLQSGDLSPNTCPECHGVLMRIREGSIVRYRCHTGHAFSVQTLLTGVNEEIDHTLADALCAVEERILFLREMEQLARANHDGATADRCARQADETEQRAQRLREITLEKIGSALNVN